MNFEDTSTDEAQMRDSVAALVCENRRYTNPVIPAKAGIQMDGIKGTHDEA